MSKPRGVTGRRLAGASLRVLGRILMLAVLGCVITAITILMILPRATNGAALTVLTGSMTPQIPVGAVVMIRPVDPATLGVGDVATYQKKPGVESFVTHRVVGIDTSTTPTSFTFKGDANRGEDIDPVPATAIRGEVWFHVPYLGAIRDALNGKAGLSLLAMLVLGGYALSQLWGAVRERRHGPTGETASVVRQFSCDRPLVLVDLPMDGLDAHAIARGLNGALLAETPETFTVLIAPPANAVEALVEELQVLEPRSIQRLETQDSAIALVPSSRREQAERPRTRGKHVPA